MLHLSEHDASKHFEKEIFHNEEYETESKRRCAFDTTFVDLCFALK